MADPVLILGPRPWKLTYDKRAIFRADSVGAWGGSPGDLGFARVCKMVWAMLPKEAHRLYPQPDDVAADLPPLADAWQAVNAAMSAAGEAMDPKNVFGSTSGPTPSPTDSSEPTKHTGN